MSQQLPKTLSFFGLVWFASSTLANDISHARIFTPSCEDNCKKQFEFHGFSQQKALIFEAAAPSVSFTSLLKQCGVIFHQMNVLNSTIKFVANLRECQTLDCKVADPKRAANNEQDQFPAWIYMSNLLFALYFHNNY